MAAQPIDPKKLIKMIDSTSSSNGTPFGLQLDTASLCTAYVHVYTPVYIKYIHIYTYI